MQKKTSSTAGYTCFSRACAAREEEPFRGPDDLAKIFLPFFARVILNVSPLRNVFMGIIAPAGIYQYVMARTIIFDRFYQRALAEGFPQIVIMGAGMDTRALRFTPQNKGTRVFELDMPAIQQAKLDIYKKKAVNLPPELVFVSADLNIQDLARVLAGGGFRKGQKTLFLCEGLFMYLDAQAVDQTLDFIRKNSSAGSRLVFDYVYASVLRNENMHYGEKGIYDTVSQAGEGWTFGIEEGVIESFVSERGFELDSHYTAADLEEQILTSEDGRLFGHINGTHCITSAQVAG